MLSSEELSYLAGFFDGEGSISISEHKPRAGYARTPQFSLNICLSNQHLGYLATLHKEFKGSLLRGQGCYRLWIGNIQAKNFLLAIKPYVKIKREQLELALTFQEMKSRRARYKKGRTLNKDEIYYGRLFRAKMKELNKKLSQAFHGKSGELLERPEKDNQQLSLPNVISFVGRKVQRLTGADLQTNKPDTSARPERDDIVRATG